MDTWCSGAGAVVAAAPNLLAQRLLLDAAAILLLHAKLALQPLPLPFLQHGLFVQPDRFRPLPIHLLLRLPLLALVLGQFSRLLSLQLSLLFPLPLHHLARLSNVSLLLRPRLHHSSPLVCLVELACRLRAHFVLVATSVPMLGNQHMRGTRLGLVDFLMRPLLFEAKVLQPVRQQLHVCLGSLPCFPHVEHGVHPAVWPSHATSRRSTRWSRLGSRST
mmetsp:Transcript_5273/g.11860  ORF Transcript_5273/g.11860 Transcript_5273/m.11860 type:complete len:219 (-) Transcript_5273:97-753(-)